MEGRGAATVLALTAAALGSSLHAASHGRRDDPEGRAAWMRQACAQARLSVPVESAYCVGCVLVKHGKVIATGFSRELPGNTHAEECALRKAGAAAEGCDLYCTMEPCSKRLSGNAPCCGRVIAAKVRRVFIGAMEPANFVTCEGVTILRDAGVEVELVDAPGIREECLAPNAHIPGVMD